MAASDRLADDAFDRRLMARIGAGDRAAFDDFYRRHARRVLAFVRDIVTSRDLAEEVASDAMVAVWHAAGRYRGSSRVLTWVLAIAHHKAVDALRRRGIAHLALNTVPDTAGRETCPADELIRCEDRLVLELALSRLTAEHRTVLTLMYTFGCSGTEIAGIVGCPVSTVKTRVFYAKRRLRIEIDRAMAAEELA